MCILTFLSIAQLCLVYSSGAFLTPPTHSSTDNLPIDMVYIKGGTFQMGDSFGDDEEGNEILHTVQVKDYLIGKCEVNFSAYDAFCKATQRQLLNDLGRGRGKQPVVNVDWFDALEYCNWRSLKEGLKPIYKIDKSQPVPPNTKKGAKIWVVSVSSLNKPKASP